MQNNFKEKDYRIFELFDKQWGIVSAGDINDFNCCTISWGSFGNIWGRAGKSCPIITIYVHPARFTSEFLLNNESFTVSFFPDDKKKALAYIGSHSGRNEDKVKNASLTPIELGNTVGFKEANLTFVCKKIYQQQFSKEAIDSKIQEYYASMPQMYPDFKGGWQPHIMFIGEIVDVLDKRWLIWN